MVNPRSFSAALRSYAENSQSGTIFPGRLRKDVEGTLDNLVWLERLSADRKVRLHCRLYNVAPSMFIYHVDERCFVQHYHFWRQEARYHANGGH